jgi:hypothetical protein
MKKNVIFVKITPPLKFGITTESEVICKEKRYG